MLLLYAILKRMHIYSTSNVLFRKLIIKTYINQVDVCLCRKKNNINMYFIANYPEKMNIIESYSHYLMKQLE